MGILVGTLFTFSVLAIGAALTMTLEHVMRRPAQEVGPAATPSVERGVKLLREDRWLYPAGAASALFGVAAAAIILPFGPDLVAQDIGVGAFYFIVVVDFVVLGLAIAGWGANTRNAVDVYYRVTAQLVSYVIPLGLAYVGAIMMARSLSLNTIVENQQSIWYIVVQPIGFALYIVTGLMQAYRAPFLEPFSSHLNYGVLSVVGGWQAFMWRLSLAGLLFVVAAMGATLYLGGWLGPWLPAPAWMLLKTFGLMALMLWLGRRVKPLTTAQMLKLSWRILTPVGLVNVLLVGGLILLGVGQ